MTETHGFLYCFINSELPHITYHGAISGNTLDAVTEHLRKANLRGTYSPGTWDIAYVKKVLELRLKQEALHSLLDKYGGRIESASGVREFFRISSEDARRFYDLVHGEYIYRNDEIYRRFKFERVRQPVTLEE